MNLRTATAGLDARRGHPFLPTDEELATVPALYATDGSGPLGEKVIHLHYFVGACDWWLAELDPVEGLAFGYACLGDLAMAEWGYVNLVELADLDIAPEQHRTPTGVHVIQPGLMVERDLHWHPTLFADVEAELVRRWGR